MKKFLKLLLAMCMLFFMTACNASSGAATDEPDDTAEETADEDTPAGSYKLTGLDIGIGENVEFISSIIDMGVNYYLFINEDGSGSMNFLEAEIPLKWDDDSITLTKIPSTPVDIPYTYANGFLELNTRAYSMEFSALTNKEQADYDTNGSGSLESIISVAVQDLSEILGGDLEEILYYLLDDSEIPDYENDPIPEGKPTAGTVSGVVDGLEYTILGADHVQEGGSQYIVFYFDVTNISNDFRGAIDSWFDGAQDGAFLEVPWSFNSIPELNNKNYNLTPGRTIRCAYAYEFDPDGGVVGFRVSSFVEDGTVLYYADPKNLTGAPESFDFKEGYTMPDEYAALPGETDYVRIENGQVYTSKGGEKLARFDFRYLDNPSGEDKPLSCIALQDGIELHVNWSEATDFETEDTSAERLRIYPCELRTDSPVIFLVYEELEDGFAYEAAWILEVK